MRVYTVVYTFDDDDETMSAKQDELSMQKGLLTVADLDELVKSGDATVTYSVKDVIKPKDECDINDEDCIKATCKHSTEAVIEANRVRGNFSNYCGH